MQNNTALNSIERSEGMFVSYFATLFSADENNADFKQVRWRTSDGVREKFGNISYEHVSRMTKLLIQTGLVEKADKYRYKITDLGKLLYQKGFKYQSICLLEEKRKGKEYLLKFISDMSNSLQKQCNHISDHILSMRSYIEVTKDEFLNISQRHPSSFEKSLLLNTDERMLWDIKRRNKGTEDHELETIFSMVRRNVGYIKDKKWFDKLDLCIKEAIKLLNECKEKWGKDGADIFSSAWGKCQTKWFTSADQISRVMRHRLGFDLEVEETEYPQEILDMLDRTDHFAHIPRRDIYDNLTHCIE